MPKAPASVFRNPVHFIAFGFGSGAVPFAPGTCGTLVAIPLYLLLNQLPLLWYLGAVLALFIVGILICDRTVRDIRVHDHGGIVWDEFVGYWITMIAAPPGWIWLLVGFVLFRFFDILKPFPINWLDKKIKGGVGVMLDDAVAGIFAWFSLQSIYILLFL